MDVRSADDVAGVLRHWLEHEFGGTVSDAEAPRSIGTGLATIIHYVSFSGEELPATWRGPLVARIHRTASEAVVARHEAAIQSWCSDHGYPAPTTVALFAPGELLDLPLQVMRRGPATTLLDEVKRSPWRAPQLVDRLASLHLQLHALPVDGWPARGEGLAERRLRLTRRFLGTHDDPDLRMGLARVEPLLPDLESAPIVACHGDFHPLNVLVDGNTSMVIDWSDAALGDRHGDVARTGLLFHFAATLAAPNRAVKAALRASQGWLSKRYLRAYERSVPLDPERLRRWEAVHLLHGWAQVLESHVGDSEFADRVPLDLLTFIRARFEAALA